MKVWLPAIRTNSGTDIYTMRLARDLAAYGIEATITWFSLAFEFAPWLLAHIPPPVGTELIHANSWHALGFHRPSLPLVVTVHHVVFDPACRTNKKFLRRIYHEGVIRPYEHAALERADAVVAVSECASTMARQLVAASKVQVIYNWIDTTEFTPGHRAKREGRCRLLFVGNLSWQKGGDLLLPIMRSLGEGYELHYTEGLKAKGDLIPWPTAFPIRRCSPSEMPEQYKCRDILIFPSRGEAFGYAAVEAMASGMPVVASRNSALPEIVVHEKTGFLCDTGKPEAFADAIRKLQDHELATAMGRAAREEAVRRFSAAANVEQYVNLYRKLAGHCRPSL